MKQLLLVITFFSALILSFTAASKASASTIYENSYNTVDISEGRVSFLVKRKDVLLPTVNDIIGIDWETNIQTSYNCRFPGNANLQAYKISKTNKIYLFTQSNAVYLEKDGWILTPEGSCFKISDLVADFKLTLTNGDAQLYVYYSENSNLLAISTTKKTYLIDIKTQTIVKEQGAPFFVGINPESYKNKVYNYSYHDKHSLYDDIYMDIYNLETFSYEKSIKLNRTQLGMYHFYFEASEKYNLKDEFFITGGPSKKYFFGTYNPLTEKAVKKFDIPCPEVQIYVNLNTLICNYSSPFAVRTSYSVIDMTTGASQLIWNNVAFKPLLSEKNGLIILQTPTSYGFDFYNLKTKTMKTFSAPPAHEYFLDRNENNIITVGELNKKKGTIEISKFSITDPTKKQLLHTVAVKKDDEIKGIFFDKEKEKVFISTKSPYGYYSDSGYYIDISQE